MADTGHDGGGSGPRIFISYRRGDTSGYAGRLSDVLRDHFGADRVFRDIDGIGTGTDYRVAIQEAVSSCDALVAVIGRSWLTTQDANGGRRLDNPDDFVRLEITAALEREILVLPVLVDSTTMPEESDLPVPLASLARRNAMDVSDSRWDYDVGRLVTRLASLRPTDPPVPPSAVSARPPEATMAPATAAPVAPTPPPPSPVAKTHKRRRPTGWPARLGEPRLAAVALILAVVLVVLVGTTIVTGEDGDTSLGPAELADPVGLAARDGSVYVADSDNHRIVRISSGEITVVAGTGTASDAGDGGPATAADLDEPDALALDGEGNLFVNALYSGGIRMVSREGTITAVPAHSPGIDRVRVKAMAVGPDGALLVASDREVLKVGPDGALQLVAGSSESGFAGDGGPATSAKLDAPSGLAIDAAGNIYVADTGNSRIRKIAVDGFITTIAGTGGTTPSGDGGPAAEAELHPPSAVVVDAGGAVYVAGSNQIRKIGPDGVIATIAGALDDTSGFSGDDGPARSALLNEVVALALDEDGTLYLSDAGNQRVRRISTDGIITTVG